MPVPNPSALVKSGAAAAGVLVLVVGFLSGCGHAEVRPTESAMGEKLTLGSLTYNVIESNWYSQLGEGFKIRSPQQRFLAVTLSITNGGGSDAAVPLLILEDSAGTTATELSNGDGVTNWMGLLRSVGPAQTLEGKILFDVPLASYKLRVTDGGGPGAEKYGWVSIPLRMDVDTGVQTPAPEGAANPGNMATPNVASPDKATK
jgi:hypothetical protein